MKNTEIRQMIKDKNLMLWEVAAAYGITDTNFSRLLRFELTGEKRQRVLDAIEKAVAEKEREKNA